MSDSIPLFHAGERAVQEREGVRAQVESWAHRAIRPELHVAHQRFYAALPYLVVAARDAEARPWATLVAGPPGFARSPAPETLDVFAQPSAGDALAGQLRAGVDLGLLGVDLATRRRNRVNGRITRAGPGGFSIRVDQSFGNCPRHIHARSWQPKIETQAPAPRRSTRLSPAQREHIAAADTLFIASGHRGDGEDRAFGMDASHRGGEPGFVRVEHDRLILIPDYSGNNLFNTIGNLVADPRAGLLFVDFEGGGLLQLTGRAQIDWDPDQIRSFPSANRLIRFTVDAIVDHGLSCDESRDVRSPC